jgi:hypothetical protein
VLPSDPDKKWFGFCYREAVPGPIISLPPPFSRRSTHKNQCRSGENQNEAAGIAKNYSFLVAIPQAKTYDFATF